MAVAHAVLSDSLIRPVSEHSSGLLNLLGQQVEPEHAIVPIHHFLATFRGDDDALLASVFLDFRSFKFNPHFEVCWFKPPQILKLLQAEPRTAAAIRWRGNHLA